MKIDICLHIYALRYRVIYHRREEDQNRKDFIVMGSTIEYSNRPFYETNSFFEEMTQMRKITKRSEN